MNPRKLVAAFGVMLSIGGMAFAQARGVRRQPAPAAPEGERPRDELFKMIDAYIVSNIQESLSLSDEQFVKLLPQVKRVQSDRRGFVQRRFRALAELRRSFDLGTATDAAVASLLKELKAVEAEEPVALRRDAEAIDAVLTPLQQAKYRVLEVEVERRLRELMSQVRRNAGAGPRQRPEGEPRER